MSGISECEICGEVNHIDELECIYCGSPLFPAVESVIDKSTAVLVFQKDVNAIKIIPLSIEEIRACHHIVSLKMELVSQQAIAILALDQGIHPAKAAEQSGLTIEQFQVTLERFEKYRMAIFPAVSLKKEIVKPSTKSSDGQSVQEVYMPEINTKKKKTFKEKLIKNIINVSSKTISSLHGIVDEIEGNIDRDISRLYSIAELEYEKRIIDVGLFSQALVKAKGDESLRKVEYMKLRVKQLKNNCSQ